MKHTPFTVNRQLLGQRTVTQAGGKVISTTCFLFEPLRYRAVRISDLPTPYRHMLVIRRLLVLIVVAGGNRIGQLTVSDC